jgi:poly-gamma-glutamate capsule biosynthesis protein CapA/YwtB (metallophosphatase superfamily)
VPAAPTIALLGDVMLGRSVAERLDGTTPAEVWAPEVRELCARCDAVVVNLECCVSAGGSPTRVVRDKPFFFRAPPAAVDALLAIGTDLAGLANNHALDFGPEALDDTLSHLRAHGIAAAGAGSELAAARRGAVVEAGSLRLGVLAVSDHPVEFAAGSGRPGIAHAVLRERLPEWVVAELERLRADADVVLAFPHWGPNMTQAPAPWQRRRSRELLAAGAHAVAGHSAHVFHGVELSREGPVLFDLGDALDDYAVDRRLRNDLGLLALWRPGRAPEVELVGLRLDFCRTELAAGRDAEWIARRLERCCGELGSRVERLEEARFAVWPAG